MGVVAPHADRVVAEGPLERRGGGLLLAVGDHDRGIDVEHDDLAEINAGNPARRHSSRDLRPHAAPDLGPCGRDLPRPTRSDLVQRPPHRRRRGDRTEHASLVAQHVDIGDRLTTIGEHHRHVDQYPSPIMNGSELATGHRHGQLPGQAGSVRQEPSRDTARVGDHADTIGGHQQAGRPRSTLHLRSAFQFENLETSQSQVSLTGQALPFFYTPTTPQRRERSGLGRAIPNNAASPETPRDQPDPFRSAPGVSVLS